METGATLATGVGPTVAAALAVNPLNAAELIAAFGVAGVLAILFAETGLLIGFFFPGDSLLFLAGVGASPFANELLPGVQLPLWPLLVGAPLCAIAGAQFGHFLGARYGRPLFQRPRSRLFKQEYVAKAEYYFARFGPGKAVVLARFIPIVRTFLNPVAGVLEMPARTFLLWNVVGGVLWTDGVLLVSYFVARKITSYIPADRIDAYLLPVIGVIVLVSLLPILVEVIRDRRSARRNRSINPLADPAADRAEPAAARGPAGTGRHRA